MEQIGTVIPWSGTLLATPVGIWVVRHVLRKTCSDFHIALVPRAGYELLDKSPLAA
jgi:hypothetical protein